MKTPVTKKPPKKSAKKRAPKQTQMIVLADGAGNLYELPRATLELSRVEKGRKKKVTAALEDNDCEFIYINAPTIPGSIVSAPLKGGRQLHYAGFYLLSTKPRS